MGVAAAVASFQHPGRSLPPELLDLYRRSNLTMGQFLFWAGQSLTPDQPIYNMGSVFTLRGPLEPTHLRRAVETVYRSSDALRTVIEEHHGVPRQRVRDDRAAPLELCDLSGREDAESRYQGWLAAREAEPFTLEEGLFYAALVRLSAREHRLYVKGHHTITDGGTVAVFLEAVSRLYNASLEGPLPASVALPSFGDHVARARRRWFAPEHADVEAYWAQKLASPPGLIPFFGELRPSVTGRMLRHNLDLGRERTRRLRALCAGADFFRKTPAVSMFNLHAAILVVLLRQLSGQSRFFLGVPFHGRATAEERQTIGLLMEDLVLSVDVRDDDTLASLAGRVADEAGESVRQRPFFVSNPTFAKVYEVTFNHFAMTRPALRGIEGTQELLNSGQGDEALAVHVHDRGEDEGLEASFDFSCDLFDDARRRAIVEQFSRLVDLALEDSRRPLAGLPRPSL